VALKHVVSPLVERSRVEPERIVMPRVTVVEDQWLVDFQLQISADQEISERGSSSENQVERCLRMKRQRLGDCLLPPPDLVIGDEERVAYTTEEFARTFGRNFDYLPLCKELPRSGSFRPHNANLRRLYLLKQRFILRKVTSRCDGEDSRVPAKLRKVLDKFKCALDTAQSHRWEIVRDDENFSWSNLS